MHSHEIAIYVHVPFCRAKCHYCDFASYTGLGHLTEPYADAVCKEAAELSGRFFDGKGCKASSIYFGGGTPSLLAADQLAQILASLPEPLTTAEITLEANPATLQPGQLRALRRLGIGRLSLGVQSFDDAMLRRLGRLHRAQDAVASYDDARAAGFDEISLDLIFGLPDQTQAGWQNDLERALQLRPEHLSLYGLTVEQGTTFGRLHAMGQLQVPGEDEQADMYLAAQETLGQSGYEQYEISNWARRVGNAVHYARHNLVYWRNEPYLGLGTSAHSSFAGRRFANTPDVAAYIETIREKRDATVWSEEVGLDTAMSETTMLGLRLSEGVDLERFARRFGCRLQERYADTIAELTALGLLALGEQTVALTPRGRMLGNEVFARFLSPRRDAIIASASQEVLR